MTIEGAAVVYPWLMSNDAGENSVFSSVHAGASGLAAGSLLQLRMRTYSQQSSRDKKRAV